MDESRSWPGQEAGQRFSRGGADLLSTAGLEFSVLQPTFFLLKKSLLKNLLRDL